MLYSKTKMQFAHYIHDCLFNMEALLQTTLAEFILQSIRCKTKHLEFDITTM